MHEGLDPIPTLRADLQAPSNDLDAVHILVDAQAADLARPRRERAAAEYAASSVDIEGENAQDTILHLRKAPVAVQESIETQEAELERRAEAEHEPGHAERERDRLRTQHRRDLEQIGAVQQLLEANAAELTRLRRELDQAQGAATSSSSRPPADDAHKLFVPTASGYKLLERPGPAPEVGTTIELNDGGTVTRYLVSKLVRPPLPDVSALYAYLQPS